MNGRTRRFDMGAVVLGAIILFAGAYYFLRNTLGFNLDELDWDPIWPILVIVLGGSILYRALTTTHREEPKA
jgi:NADH:ubiquinone oxidoreductase subunit 4 (subunit M)